MKNFLIFLGIAGAIGAGIYFIVKKKGSSYGSPSETRRLGYPKTEAQRLATHKQKYGTTELPERGTGLSM